ncbi:hypothetical protein [Candidatus Berkiella aquae]|uniref:Lipase (Class 3) n=1 Tax=Candidatus Berkiella aquae TaxID=295108 RepID=A0A0Q9YEG6_9GAMM|nr:hypothetical protein [Candidatus Berkiella aquae]MCS5711627.1 hypothetical protein [Candidatus Berkiella aquae]
MTTANPLSLEHMVNKVLNPATSGKEEFNVFETQFILETLKHVVGHDLYNNVINKYQIQHINDPGNHLNVNDLRALMIGISTNTSANDLASNQELRNFLENNQVNISQLAKEQRQELAKHMDKTALKKKNPLVGFCLRVGKAITDVAVKANDLKDAFAGVQINKAFEEDIKTVATMHYSNTYTAGYQENGIAKGISSPEIANVMTEPDERKKLASGLYLATDLAYRNLNQGSVIPVLDDDGQNRLYRVHNIANDKGLVCTALIPYEPGNQLDVKILFRGTHSGASASVDLETTGAGSKTMRDNRIKLLDEVNKIVGDLQASQPGSSISLSIQGHSLGGAFAERFTSEVHQAIYHANSQGGTLSTEQIQQAAQNQDLYQGDDAHRERTKMVTNVQERVALNNREMQGKDYSALSNLSKINTTSANSARLNSIEAYVGEGFIALNQSSPSAPQQSLNYFKARGDWVSQAGMKNLGSGFGPNSQVDVALLRKHTDYGVSNIHPILGHCDHPLMRYHDKSEQAPRFDYLTNHANGAELKSGLTSGRTLPRVAQKLYGKTPQAIIEPITWAKKQIAKVRGKDPIMVKGFNIQTEAQKQEAKQNDPTKRRP